MSLIPLIPYRQWQALMTLGVCEMRNASHVISEDQWVETMHLPYATRTIDALHRRGYIKKTRGASWSMTAAGRRAQHAFEHQLMLAHA